MSFDEIRLPVEVERGASGGPEFNTTILTLSSGFEQRNQNWSFARGKWDIGYGIRTKNDLILVIAFFYARRGQARGFRFRDWSDYEVTSLMQFGTGNGVQTDFQLSKTYTSGSNPYIRQIKKPVSGAKIFVNSVELTSGFSINTTTGIVTFSSAPANGNVLSWTGEFDVPVRFDDDDLTVSMQIFNAGSIPSINIVEIRI